MHVNEQIAVAVVQTLIEKVSGFASVAKYGVPPTGRRRYPNAVVIPDAARIDTQLSGNRRSGRVQTRTLTVGVAIRDRKTDEGDWAARLMDLAAATEDALAGWDALPVDDIVLVGTSEVQDLDQDGREGVDAGVGLSFEIRFQTVEGVSTAFAVED